MKRHNKSLTATITPFCDEPAAIHRIDSLSIREMYRIAECMRGSLYKFRSGGLLVVGTLNAVRLNFMDACAIRGFDPKNVHIISTPSYYSPLPLPTYLPAPTLRILLGDYISGKKPLPEHNTAEYFALLDQCLKYPLEDILAIQKLVCDDSDTDVTNDDTIQSIKQ